MPIVRGAVTVALPVCAAKVRGRGCMGSGVASRCRRLRRSTACVQDQDVRERPGLFLPPRPAEAQLSQFSSGRFCAHLDRFRRRMPIAPGNDCGEQIERAAPSGAARPGGYECPYVQGLIWLGRRQQPGHQVQWLTVICGEQKGAFDTCTVSGTVRESERIIRACREVGRVARKLRAARSTPQFQADGVVYLGRNAAPGWIGSANQIVAAG